jgi:hypothetical protein
VAKGAGKRSGSRKGARSAITVRPVIAAYAAAITVAVIAWGYLVFAAIDFGVTARGGTTAAWWLLGLASVGAMACMFVALMLVSRLTRALGLTSAPPGGPQDDGTDAAETRPAKGHRAAR